MTFGLLDSGVNCPERQAFYQVSVRHIKFLPTASFRFCLTTDTLAFDYRIPIITAPRDLKTSSSHLLVLIHARHTPILRPPDSFGEGLTAVRQAFNKKLYSYLTTMFVVQP